jgi:hypothetical protein
MAIITVYSLVVHPAPRAQQLTDAPCDLLPILIGVTGKRQFADDPIRNRHLLQIFAERFRALIARLDEICPDTPKALLCGGAAGTDLMAARVALERPSWSVVLVVPLDRELFEQDFQDQPFADDLPYLRSLWEGHPRVVVKTLRRLHVDPFDDSKLEPLDVRRFGHDDLVKHTGKQNIARAQHFEQLGLWLARTATLLVAAAPAETTEEKPFRLGGSARVVAYRRTATPDPDAEEVINRSSELLSNSPFEEPDGGYVLWIDPTREVPSTGECELPGAETLRPIQRSRDLQSHDVDFLFEVDAIYAAPMHDPLDGTVRRGEADTSYRRERGALATAYAFQRMHSRRLGWRRLCPCRPPAPPPLFDAQHPAEFLAEARDGNATTKRLSAISRQQTAAAYRTRSALRVSALLFLLAIACYEASTEVFHRQFWLWLYLILLLGIAGIAGLVRLFRVQLLAEDFRGLKEMMRVQIIWWSAGIDRMVDRVHLRTVDTDLRLVREAAATIANWAVLRCTALPDCNASALNREMAPVHYAQKWIDDQARYFADNAEPQFGAKHLAETTFTVTFTASITALLLMLLADWLVPVAGEWAKTVEAPALALLPIAAGATIACGLWLITGRWRGSGRRRLLWLAWCFAALAAVATVLTELKAGHSLLGAWTRRTPNWPLTDGDWTGPGLMMLGFAGLAWTRIPEKVMQFDVQRLRRWQLALGLLLMVATVSLAALGLAPDVQQADPWEAVRSLVLAQAVLLLGGSGMVRWYTERRNHLAQAARYDDMLRVFRRAQTWLRARGPVLDRAAQQELVDLGELALNENEAWLKAHRERPSEPIAGS